MVFQQSYSPVQWIDSETTYGRRCGGPRAGRNRRAPAAQRSRSRSCTRCGPSRMSRSRASGTRSRTPASTRGKRARRVRPLRTLTEQAGREPAEVGSRSGSRWVRNGSGLGGGAGSGRSRLLHVTLTTNFNRRIPGRTGDHLALRPPPRSRTCFRRGGPRVQSPSSASDFVSRRVV